MVKLLFFALSLFNFSFSNDYQLVTEETADLSNVVFYQDNIILKNVVNDESEENAYLLFIDEKEYQINASMATGIINNDYFLLIYYQGEYLYSQRFFFDGLTDEPMSIFWGEITGELFIEVIDGAIYCAFTEYYKDNYNPQMILIDYYEFNVYVDEFHYGKEKDEKLVGFDVFEKSIFFLVQKDQITESEFGNGGCDDCYVIARLKNNKVEKIITIDCNDELKYFCVRNGFIYLVLKNKLYLFDLDLNLLNTLIIDNLENVFIGYNQVILIITNNSLDLYDAVSLIKLDSLKDLKISNYHEFNNVLYGEYQNKCYLFDIIDYRKMMSIEKYLYEYEEIVNNKLKDVSSLFGDCQFIEKEYLEYYKRNAYGDYHLKIKYYTKGLIRFQKELIEEVPLQININNNNIYPNGYRLRFNGEGYLDGNNIISNHAVINDGKHQLVIKGANTEATFEFYVSSDQYLFDDSYCDDDLINVNVGKDFSVFYKLNKDIVIEDIIVYGAIVRTFEVKDQQLEIVFEGLSNLGITNIIIEKFIYQEAYYLQEIYLNKVFVVNVYNDEISFNDVIINEDCGFEVEYYDLLKQGRFIDIRFINQKDDYSFSFPIGDCNINFKDINQGNYVMVVSLRYDNGCYQLVSREIYRMVVDVSSDFNLGEIKLLNESNGNYKIRLEINKQFKKNNILELKDNDKVIYSYQEAQRESLVMYCIIGFIGCFLLVVSFKYFCFKRGWKKIRFGSKRKV